MGALRAYLPRLFARAVDRLTRGSHSARHGGCDQGTRHGASLDAIQFRVRVYVDHAGMDAICRACVLYLLSGTSATFAAPTEEHPFCRHPAHVSNYCRGWYIIHPSRKRSSRPAVLGPTDPAAVVAAARVCPWHADLQCLPSQDACTRSPPSMELGYLPCRHFSTDLPASYH